MFPGGLQGTIAAMLRAMALRAALDEEQNRREAEHAARVRQAIDVEFRVVSEDPPRGFQLVRGPVTKPASDGTTALSESPDGSASERPSPE